MWMAIMIGAVLLGKIFMFYGRGVLGFAVVLRRSMRLFWIHITGKGVV